MKTAATTIEQSERLVALGIDPHMADMCYMYGRIEAFNTGVDGDVPAWSLSALLDNVLPKVLYKNGLAYGYQLTLYWDETVKVWRVMYDAIGDNICGGNANPDLFTACIDLIEQLVEQGYINTKKA